MQEILPALGRTNGDQITTCTEMLSKPQCFTSSHCYCRDDVNYHLNIRKVLQAFLYGLKELIFP